VWEFAHEHRLHVLSHSFPSPAALDALAARYPNTTILAGHAAGSGRLLPDYCAVAAGHPNVFLDLCGSLLYRGALEQMVALAGTTQILYGSDIPFLDPRPQLGRVAFAHLDDDTLRAILGENAERVWRGSGQPRV
ncbi:MAG TPA: amidohydrolase family protein, partial [Chloroflexota bacterium]|nr:amidohydrolase family protein [Chloroflexota bacterium]